MSSLTDQPEQNTTASAASGPDSVQSLIHEHYQSVYRFAYRLSGKATDAEDLTQQAFLMACRKIDQLRDGSKARSWLFTIVRNSFLKSIKKQPTELSTFEDEIAVIDDPSSLNLHFDEEKLQSVLNEMPEVYRTPVLLFYFEDLSYKEISTLLEVPIGTIMSRLARGKQHLREQLSESLN